MSDETLYPASIEAERAALGAILLDEQAANIAVDLLQPDDFYREAHRTIFESVVALATQARAVDEVTLFNHLKSRGEDARMGGLPALADLARETGSAANIESHCHVIREKSQLRRLMEATERIRRSVTSSTPVPEILESAEREIFEVASRRSTREPELIGSMFNKTFERIEELVAFKGNLTGVTTGFKDLDEKTSGFQKSDLIILAGRPSMGKTSLAVNMMEAVALDEKKPVVFFSLEMSREAVVMRFLSSAARVPFWKIRNGRLNEEDMTSLGRAADRLGRTKLHIDDSVGISPLEVRSRCRRLVARTGPLGLIVVDYLQLMSASRRIDSRVQEVSEISRMLKAVARELETPVLALSQLSRAPEQRTDRRPQLSDLRDSGAIEQDADIVAFIHREDYAGSGAMGGSPEAELLIRKHRNGETGTVKLVFIGELMRFESAAEDTSYDRETAVIG